MSLRLNPEYDKLLPRMSSEEFAELKISIETEGQHYPIIVNEDLQVLDGHHRFRVCNELGIEPDFEVKRFEDKLLEKKFRAGSQPAASPSQQFPTCRTCSSSTKKSKRHLQKRGNHKVARTGVKCSWA